MSEEMQKYIDGIKSTGFVLEFKISEILRKSNWNIINSRYYIDDFEGSVREIDIVAYKTTLVEDFRIFTTLIISCKKDEKNLWAFLSKNSDRNDVNIERKPIHTWTNHKVLNYTTSQNNFKDDYYQYIFTKINGIDDWTQSEFHTFAFQIMDKLRGSAQNDKPIFDSITSLVKAQAYEIQSLDGGRKSDNKKYIYQFNLISVIESDLIRLHFEDDNITPIQIEQENHIFRYIVHKKQIFARVHFVKSSSFEELLKQYNLLHQANCIYFKEKHKGFYENLLTDDARINVFKKDSERDILKILKIHEYRHSFLKNLVDISLITNTYKVQGVTKLEIYSPTFSDEEIIDLAKDEKLNDSIKPILIKYYRYMSDFTFTNTPF